MQRRAIFLSGLGTAVAVAALPRRGAAQTPPAPMTLRVGFTLGDDMTPIVYGLKSGIFAKDGLDLQLSRMSNGPAILSGMLAGSFDLGKSNITTLLEAHEKGLPVTMVAAASVNNPKAAYGAFLLLKDTPMKTGKDFNNQLVGVASLGGIGNIALMKWVDDHGGDAKSIKFVEVPTAAAPAAVDQGRVVASESSYPAMAAAVDTGRMRVATLYDALGNGFIQSAKATTRDFSSKHPEAIRAFARAYRDIIGYTNAHRGDTVAMMAEFTGISAELIAKMPRATPSAALAAAQIQPVIDALVKYGVLKASFPAADLIDPNVR